MRVLKCKLLLASSLLTGLVDSSLAQDSVRYTSSTFVLPPDVENMLSVDLNADTYPDLVALQKETLNVYLQQPNGGFAFSRPSASIELPGAGMGWDIVDYRAPGAEQAQPRLMALVDGRRVIAWDFAGNTVSEPVTVLDGLTGYLPRGLFRVRFAQDINDDGHMDFVVPGAEQLHLYLQNAGGSFQEGISVQSSQFGQTVLWGARLQARAGQSLYVPLMELRDLNSDGFNDLISRSEDSIDVFYSQTGGATPTFSTAPVYSVDLTVLRAAAENFTLDQLDFSDLAASLAMTYNVLMNDVNADGLHDVVIREGGKISLFTSSATGIDFATPQQVLRSSGNVLAAYIRDENGDGLGDLWLARVEAISIGDVFVWLALAGTLEVEVFIYRNEGTQFTRRPSRKLTVAVKYPSALNMLSAGMSMQRTMEAAAESLASPFAMANLNDKPLDEMAVLVKDRLDVYFDVKEPEDDAVLTREEMEQRAERSVLALVGYRDDRDAYEIDIRKIMDEFLAQASASNDLVAGRAPDMQLPLGTSTEVGDVFAVDLNQDGIDDFVVFLDGDDERIDGMLFMSSRN